MSPCIKHISMHGACLMKHVSCLMKHVSWSMSHEACLQHEAFSMHEAYLHAWSMSHEACLMKHVSSMKHVSMHEAWLMKHATMHEGCLQPEKVHKSSRNHKMAKWKLLLSFFWTLTEKNIWLSGMRHQENIFLEFYLPVPPLAASCSRL